MDYTYLKNKEFPTPTTDVPEHSLYECGICSCYHLWKWNGDCRDNDNRYPSLDVYAEKFGINEDDITLYSMNERLAADQGDPNWLHAEEDGWVVNEEGYLVEGTEISV